MNRVLSLLLLSVLASVAAGAPPLAGGFMTGNDSAVYVYWFHPEVQVWEMGLEGDSGTYDIFPTSTPGVYSMAQRVSLPRWSLVTRFSERLHVGDHYPNWPGTQFSPFGYSVYAQGDDSLPQGAPLVAGRDSLLPADAAGGGWVHHPLAVANLTGQAVWFSHDWDPLTPSAPEIKAVRPQGAAGSNRLGIGSGENRVWNNIPYALVFRYRFLTLFASDSEAVGDWRKIDGEPRPQGFTITRYESSKNDSIEVWNQSPDTLLRPLANGPGDSIAIRTGCGEAAEEEALTLIYDSERTLPIAAAIDCGGCDSIATLCLCHLQVVSHASEPITVLLGLDRSRMAASIDRITIPPLESATVPITVTRPADESRPDFIILDDDARHRYPYLVIVDYTWTGPSDVNDPVGSPGPHWLFSVTPNPIMPGHPARFRARVASGPVEIFNILGQRVQRISITPGKDATWDGRDGDGRLLSAGVYFARMEGGRDRSNTVKIILVR